MFTYERIRESARERRIALYKSDQQQRLVLCRMTSDDIKQINQTNRAQLVCLEAENSAILAATVKLFGSSRDEALKKCLYNYNSNEGVRKTCS